MAAGKGGGHAGNSGQLRQVMGCSFEVKKEIRHGEWTKLLIFKWLRCVNFTSVFLKRNVDLKISDLVGGCFH